MDNKKIDNLKGWLVIAVCLIGILSYKLISTNLSNNKKQESYLKGSSGDTPAYGSDKFGCAIKGNISFTTGEKIYHLPSDPFYGETTIDVSQGEQWFCNVQEAESAGWRRADH